LGLSYNLLALIRVGDLTRPSLLRRFRRGRDADGNLATDATACLGLIRNPSWVNWCSTVLAANFAHGKLPLATRAAQRQHAD